MITITLTLEEVTELLTWGDAVIGDYPEQDCDRLGHELFARLGKELEEAIQPNERPTD